MLRGWARDGLADTQIAHNMDIAVSTLYEWKKNHSEISEALKKGKEVADYQVENALYQAALDGNVTAMIFWLKNRKASIWRDKPKEPDNTRQSNNLAQALDHAAKEVWEK